MNNDKKNYRVCYFGIYPLRFPRDTVCLRGLELNGASIIECVDSAPSLRKYINLIRKQRALKNDCDVIFVSYLSVNAVIAARCASRKKIIYNACNSMYESVVIERELHSRFSLRAIAYWLMDFFSFHCAHAVLVESEEQKKFIEGMFFVPRQKIVRVWTSADERVFFKDSSVKKRNRFTVMFRGQFAPFVGIEYVIEAARLLKDEDIDFIIMGWGMLTPKVKEMIAEHQLKNIRLITDFLPFDEMRTLMLSSHALLGQFADHPRARRTIANKSFESIALGEPFITADLPANRELFVNGENALLVRPSDAADLARAIVELKNDKKLRDRVARGGYELFQKEASVSAIGGQLSKVLDNLFVRSDKVAAENIKL